MKYWAVIVVFLAGCAATTAEETVERTIPEPLFAQELPDLPEKVPPDKRMSVAATGCVVEGSDPPQKLPPGILMSYEMGLGVSRTKVAYDELRSLYKTDLATMDRERQIYQRHLEAADEEANRWRERSKRTWLERNGGALGVAVGIVIGAAFTVGIVAAVEGVTEGIE